MENSQDDGWLRQLAQKELAAPAPPAAVADRVLACVRSLEIGSAVGLSREISMPPRYRTDDLVQSFVIGLAAMAAVWLAWLAFPAWQDLSSPPLSVRYQLVDAMTLRR